MARYLAAIVLYHGGIFWLCRWLRRGVGKQSELAVLGLHRVLTAEEFSATSSEVPMTVLLPTFVRLLDMLHRDFEVTTLAELQSGLLPPGKKPLCLLTFDDAWVDTFTNAVPALRRAGLTAVVFVPTALLGSTEPFWVERLTCVWKQSDAAQQAIQTTLGCRASTLAEAITALKKLPAGERNAVVATLSAEFDAIQPAAVDCMMSWQQLEQSTPALEIGSHTVHHVLLDCEDEATARRELLDSRAELHRRTGRAVCSLAYPNGNQNAKVREWARQAGYEWAFTVRAGIYREGDDRMQVPRMLIQESNLVNPWGGFSPAMAHLRLMGWR